MMIFPLVLALFLNVFSLPFDAVHQGLPCDEYLFLRLFRRAGIVDDDLCQRPFVVDRKLCMNPCQCFTFGIAVPLHQPRKLRYRIDVHQPRFVNVRIVFYLLKQGHVKENDRIFFIFFDFFDFPVDAGMDEGE